MKKLTIRICTILTIIGALAYVGCVTNTQTKAINTIGSLETAVDNGYKFYVTLVVQGKIGTNDVPRVSKAFNDFQAAAIVATVTVQNNTNAIAPDSLTQQSAAFVGLTTTLTSGH